MTPDQEQIPLSAPQGTETAALDLLHMSTSGTTCRSAALKSCWDGAVTRYRVTVDDS